MGGWGRTTIVVAPNGEALPCQAAATIPGLEFANVKDHSLDVDLERVGRVHALPRHGLDAGAVPQSCPLGRQEEDCGRLPLPGAPPHRRRRGDRSRLPVLAAPRPVVAAREPAQTDEFVYRTMKRPRVAERA